MLGFVEQLGFPPSPIVGAVIIICAIIWGTQSRRKNRPYLLAMQAALVACMVSTLALALQGDSIGVAELLSEILRITFGYMLMHWALCWLIIALIFTIRGRNDNANIFTRNRNK